MMCSISLQHVKPTKWACSYQGLFFPFLNTGTTLARSQLSGTSPVSYDFWKIRVKLGAITGDKALRILKVSLPRLN